MRRRHLGQALGALAVMLTVIGLGGLPASAATVTITGGSFDWYSSDSTLLTSEDVTDSWEECPGSTNSDVMTHSATTHAWTFQSDRHVKRTFFFSQNYTVVSQFSSGGTSSGTGASTGTATYTLDFYPRTATGPCSTAPTPCTIAATGITLSATHTVASTSLEVSDTVHLTGDNGGANGHGDFGFEVNVTGPATSCGSLLAYYDGGFEISSLTFHVTTV